MNASLFTRDCAKYFTEIIVFSPHTVDTIFGLGLVLQMKKWRADGTEWAGRLTPQPRTLSTALQYQWYWRVFLLSRNENELCLNEKRILEERGFIEGWENRLGKMGGTQGLRRPGHRKAI